MTILFGIKNCDKVRAARRWLEQHGVDHVYHDFRDDGLPRDRLAAWIEELGLDTLINRRSTTWKQLSDADKSALDGAGAIDTLVQHPTLIKRPLLDTGRERHLGFSEKAYGDLFRQHTL